MASPKKSKGPDSGSPRLARFIAGSVRRRQSINSKRSFNTETESGSTQRTTRKWMPRKKDIETSKENQADNSRDVAISPASSKSSKRLDKDDQSVDLVDVSLVGGPRDPKVDDLLDKGILPGRRNEIEKHVLQRSRMSLKLGGRLPGTPPGYQNLEEPSSPGLVRTVPLNSLSDCSETIVFHRDSMLSVSEDVSRDNDEEREGEAILPSIHQGSQHMVSSIRSTSERDGFMQIMRRDQSAGDLQSLCACMTTLDEVRRARSFFIDMSWETASRRNHKGETYLHALSNNKSLAVNLTGQNEFETKDYLALYRQPTFDQESSDELREQVTKFLSKELLSSFPGAMLTQDNKGYVPFEEGLLDWIATNQKRNHTEAIGTENYATYLATVSDAVSHAWKSTSNTFLTAVSKMTDTDTRIGDEGDVEAGEGEELKQASSTDELTGNKVDPSKSSNNSKLSPHARFCLEMLSLIVEQLESCVTALPTSFGTSNIDVSDILRVNEKMSQDLGGSVQLAAQIVEHVASIPELLRTILSITEEVDMEFALSTTIIRRVLLDKHSIGPWLTSMLRNPHRSVSRRAIDYLHNVSKLYQEEEKERRRYPSSRKIICDDVIDEVSRLRDFVPSLLSLGENGMEEASTTKVVSDVLDKMISRPFVATVVLCDAIFLGMVIVGFRYAVNGMIMGASLDTVLSWIYVANIGIFYFLIQEIGKIVSLLLISSHARKYFLSFWNVIDVLAIVLALMSSVAMRWQFAIHMEGLDDANPLRGLLAVSTGFLWLRVLSFLKSINIQLATFILAIITITKDILFFCVILLILVISFSQMFFTLLAPSSCAADSEQQQCSQTEYLIQFYIMMLGDFGNSERSTFTTGFSVFLMVLYSFLVTVILLNVLIAIASDSYEKCLLNSQKLFGRARVMLVAELVSFQSLLRKREDHGDEVKVTEDGVYSDWWMSGSWSWTRKWSRGSVLFFCLSMFVTVIWTVAEVVGFARGDKYVRTISSLSSVFVTIALYITVIMFLGRNAVSVKLGGDQQRKGSNILQRVVLRVLEAKQDKREARRRRRRGQGEWHGRVQFLQREMDRMSEKQNDLINEQSHHFQTMVNQSEARLRSELRGIEERFRETNHSIVSAVDELKALISMAGSTAPGLRSPVPEEVEFDFQ